MNNVKALKAENEKLKEKVAFLEMMFNRNGVVIKHLIDRLEALTGEEINVHDIK